MSERRERKRHREVLADALAKIQLREQEDADVKQAIEKALACLAEVPKTETHCEIKLEYSGSPGTLQAFRCSECQTAADDAAAISIGDLDNLRYCYRCGAKVDNKTRERDAFQRSIDAGVINVMKRLEAR